MKCTVEERPSKIFVGFKKRFHGVPYGQERLEQENEFYTTTRGKQWLLLGAADDYTTEYAVVTNIDDDDFYIAYESNYNFGARISRAPRKFGEKITTTVQAHC